MDNQNPQQPGGFNYGGPVNPAPAQPPYQYRPPQPQQPPADPNRHLRQAGTFAIWLWILAFVAPIAVVLLCCFGCFAGGIVGGGANPTPTP